MRNLLAFALLAAPAASQESEEPVSFHRDVRPILQRSCQGCHQPAKPEGDVVLVRHADLLSPIEYGDDAEAAVQPGQPAASLLVDVITPFGDLAPEMPEDGEPLSADEVDLIRRWIAEGAKNDTPPGVGPGAGAPPVYRRPPVVTTLDYSPDGRFLAVAGRGEVLLHRSDGTERVKRLVGLSSRIESIAFSPDGNRLAVAGGSPGLMGELQIWHVDTAELELSVPVTFDTIQGVSWSGDGERIAFGCKDATLRAVDARSGEELLYQNSHEDWVLGTAFSADGTHVVSVGRDRSLKLVKFDTQQFIDNITSITPGALRGGLMSVKRHPERDELLVGGADGIPKTYRMYREKKRVIGDDYNLLQSFGQMPGRIFSTAWAPDGTRVVAGSSSAGTGEVRAYGVENGEQLWARPFDGGIYAVAFHPREDRVAAAGFDGIVRILDAQTGATVVEFVPVPLDGVDPIEAAAELAPAGGKEGEDS